MRVQVRYFASLADLVGTSGEEIEIDGSASVADLWALLGRRHAGLSRMTYRPLVACDLEYASYESTLEGVGEVAFLPPVSGG